MSMIEPAIEGLRQRFGLARREPTQREQARGEATIVPKDFDRQQRARGDRRHHDAQFFRLPTSRPDIKILPVEYQRLADQQGS